MLSRIFSLTVIFSTFAITSCISTGKEEVNIEKDMGEIYSNLYGPKIIQFFVEEAQRAGVKKIRALKSTDDTSNVEYGPAGLKNCTLNFDPGLILIEINDPRCVQLHHLAHEIAHIGSKCGNHNPTFFKYNYAIAQRYEMRFPEAGKRKWFTPVQDVANTEAFRRGTAEYLTKKC